MDQYAHQYAHMRELRKMIQKVFSFFFFSCINKYITWKLSEKLFIPCRLLFLTQFILSAYCLQDNFLAFSYQFELSPITEILNKKMSRRKAGGRNQPACLSGDLAYLTSIWSASTTAKGKFVKS